MPSYVDTAGAAGDDAADPERTPAVVSLADDGAGELLGSLTSETAREMLAALEDSPRPPSALADAVDTSLQNVHYHLDRMEAAGAVEVIDTAYSEKGREMAVYAPTGSPLVVVSADEDADAVVAALERLLGGVAVLSLASVLVKRALTAPTRLAPGVDPNAYAVAPTVSPPPVGLYAFVAGLVLLCGWVAVRYRRERR
ncbi:MAG: ArsR/SmtB family transcription factor [Halobacteriaceae archaeon]